MAGILRQNKIMINNRVLTPGMWHVTIPIKDNHRFLHYLRWFLLDCTPIWQPPSMKSPFLIVQHRWFRKPKINITKSGVCYCNHFYAATKQLETWVAKQPKETEIDLLRIREAVPVMLMRFDFTSIADYLVTWSICHGALGRVFNSLVGSLSIFDHLGSYGFKTYDDYKKEMLCDSVKESV